MTSRGHDRQTDPETNECVASHDEPRYSNKRAENPVPPDVRVRRNLLRASNVVRDPEARAWQIAIHDYHNATGADVEQR
jgi:hypothetical protein